MTFSFFDVPFLLDLCHGGTDGRAGRKGDFLIN